MNADSAIIVGIAFTALSLAAFGLLWLIVRVAGALRPATTGNTQHYVSGTATPPPPLTNDWLSRVDRWLFFMVRDTGWPLTPATAVFAILGVSAIAGGAMFIAFENELLSAVTAALAAIVAFLTGIALVTRRRKQVADQLPGWIDVLARSLRAGRSLEQALRASLQKLKGPFAAELHRCTDQLELGLRVDEAFGDLGARFRSLELQMVIGALAMSRQTGGDLPTTLERLATVARQRLEYRRQTRAASSSARFAAICLAIAPPAIFAYYWFTGQFAATLLQDPSGQFSLALAIGLELIGIVWMLYLSRAEI